MAPSHAHAHALSPGTVLFWWTFKPFVLATLLGSIYLYVTGVRRVWNKTSERVFARWETASYGLGMLTLVVALFSPVDALGAVLFSAHMTQHELLMLIAAPLVVLGRPLLAYLWALPSQARARVGAMLNTPVVSRPWRFLTGPLAVLILHGVVLWGWHIPLLFETAMRHPFLHAVQHFMFFMTAALFWWALIHGRYGKAGYGVSVFFVFATGMHSGILGALLTFARKVWYPIYLERGAPWQVDVFEDQQLAGLLMWVPAGVVFLVVGLALFSAWVGESERKVRQVEALGRETLREVKP